MTKPILLGVNIDHVATLRQARGTRYPDPLQAVFIAEDHGADGITVHLREDRRHIQDRDVERIANVTTTRLNLEMAVVDEMVKFALKIKPEHCCLVPERREELTTEGGLDVRANFDAVKNAVTTLQDAGIQVSLFIDPDKAQIDAAIKTGALAIEIHTGSYADCKGAAQEQELQRVIDASAYAAQTNLIVNAGHGLNYQNVQSIAKIPVIHELNIGHGIVSRAVFSGLGQAVSDMKQLMVQARTESLRT